MPQQNQKKLRYLFFKLLKKFLQLKPKEQHAILLEANLTMSEKIQLAKAVNGVVYHNANYRTKVSNAALTEDEIDQETTW